MSENNTTLTPEQRAAQEEAEKKRQHMLAEENRIRHESPPPPVPLPEGSEPPAKRQKRIDYALSTNVMGLPNHVLQEAINMRREAGLPTTKGEEADHNSVAAPDGLPAIIHAIAGRIA